MMGSSGVNGESVPKATVKPVFLRVLIHWTAVPAFTQKNWLALGSGTLGLIQAPAPCLRISTLQGVEADPQVFCALHRSSGLGSSQAYLLAAWEATAA